MHLTHIYVFSIGQIEKKLFTLEHWWILRFFTFFTKMSIFRVMSQVFENTVDHTLQRLKDRENKFCNFITIETLRSQNCSIWSSSILNKMTSKFANYLTLGYSRISLRRHWVTFWICRVIYKSRAIERTSNHTLTTRSCWAMTPPHQNEFWCGV